MEADVDESFVTSEIKAGESIAVVYERKMWSVRW